MARRLARYDWPNTGGRGNRKTDNPLLNGAIWLLTEGKDFDGSVHTHRSRLQTRARRAGFRLRTAITDKGELVLQATPVARS
jgi:hypothetical protein